MVLLITMGVVNMQEFNRSGVDSAVKNSGRRGAVTLSMESVRKMIMKFLLEKNMSKEDLSHALGTKVEKLNLVLSKNASEIPAGLLYNVNKHLVPLYCSTRWEQQEVQSS